MTCYDMLLIFIKKNSRNPFQPWLSNYKMSCWTKEQFNNSKNCLSFQILSAHIMTSHLWPRHRQEARTACPQPVALGSCTTWSPRSQCSSPPGWSSEQTQSHTASPRPPEKNNIVWNNKYCEYKVYLCDENVLRLDIPVQTVVKVTEVNCLESLPHDALRKINKIVKIPNVICLLMLVDITSRQQKFQRASNVREHNR